MVTAFRKWLTNPVRKLSHGKIEKQGVQLLEASRNAKGEKRPIVPLLGDKVSALCVVLVLVCRVQTFRWSRGIFAAAGTDTEVNLCALLSLGHSVTCCVLAAS